MQRQTSYFHYIDATSVSASPSLQELTEAVAGELESEGNFGPAKNLRVTSAKLVGNRNRCFKCRVRGPRADIEIIRSNLRAEYGKLTAPID
jgi:hypothetical protein